MHVRIDGTRWRTHTAGASLFLPIVRKNSDISWKQSSRTVSTTLFQFPSDFVVREAGGDRDV
jgi:hypothetical protein